MSASGGESFRTLDKLKVQHINSENKCKHQPENLVDCHIGWQSQWAEVPFVLPYVYVLQIKKRANPVPEAPTWVGSGEEKNRGKPSPPKICREAASNPRPWDSSHHCTRPALHMFYRLLYYILGLTCHAEWKLKYQSILHHPKKSKVSMFSLWAWYMVFEYC